MVNAKDSARGENGEFSDMYNGYSMIETKLDLHFFGGIHMKISVQTGGACNILGADAGMKAIKDAGFDAIDFGELCVSLCRLTLDSEFTNSRMENAMEVNLLLYQLALAVIRKSFPKKESNMVMSRFERLAPVLSHIGEKLDKMCPIGELSEIMELSEDSFYRDFKSTIGQAPKEYLISERLRKARILLASSQVSVTDISKQCGYENPFYFSTLFHGKYGLSPSAYREKTSALMAILT